MEDYYQTLGVRSKASQEEIKERFRFLAHAYHPDKFSTSTHKKHAEETFKKINEAYRTLSDPGGRAEYDKRRSSSGSTYKEERRRREEAKAARRRAEEGRGRDKMKSVEAEGWTIEEAISAALRQLQVERKQVKIEVLCQPTKGFLGIGGKKAQIRAILRVPPSNAS